MDSLREKVVEALMSSEEWTEQAKAVLAIPEIAEALNLKQACDSAFAVNGEFVITKEVLAGKGVTVTAMPK